ncbi:efflux RND transporter periplasmic adaptor subunit [Marimonas arenosa]|uniref:Efflux RND transporter periplasmic adaptor subunit n=1 Tax=Marimonas arenosa TaxID=1795305 RepID=A0AAE3WG12_9RHOB|nr:efflux RND transporter periplasmic adaptor subunit [Marimonas arenosa]MDQ2091052.1 efflux RND transporter periplasmic adaptor subunit [Marimonas arenosa]
MANKQGEIERRLGLNRTRRRRIWIWLAALAALAAGAVWYFMAGDADRSGPRYATAAVSRGDITVMVTATGTVEPTNLVTISSELSGTIERVSADFNDIVTAGQELARLDTTKLEALVAVQRAQLRAAEARVVSAEATLAETLRSYENIRKLDERGVATHTELVNAKAAFDRARASLQVANADRQLAESNLALQQADLDKACICSPINGVVLDRQVDPGQIVASSLNAPTLFTVAEDLTKMELQVYVDEADIGQLKQGNRGTFTVDAYDDRVFPAEIESIRYASETVDGVVSYLATLSLENTDLALRPGMTATADIVVAELTDVLRVPNRALRFAPPQTAEGSEEDDNRSGLLGMIMPHRPQEVPKRSLDTVWVLRDGVATEIEVQTGATDGDFTEIIGSDLSEGDAVITDQDD